LLATIPADKRQYSLITYDNLIGFINTIANEDINYIDITVCDEEYNIIDFNGISIYLTLQINSIIKDFENSIHLEKLLNNGGTPFTQNFL